MKFQKKVLPNGLKMIVAPMADNPTVTVLVLVSTGSDYEVKEKNGISHFLEHMCFKGTATRPNTSDLSIELDALGCQYNAFTGNEYTGYYAKGKSTDFEHLLDVVSDLYLNPLLKKEEIEKEKGVIVDEINMYEDLPMRKVHDVWAELLYGNTPAGRSIAGTREIVRGLSREDILSYRTAHYVARATTVIVAGNVTPKDAFKSIAKQFKGIHAGKKSSKEKTKEVQSSPNVATLYKETDQTHLVLGVRSFSVKDKRNFVMAVLSGILGSGMSSRLFRKIRDEMGVGYYVRAENSLFTDHGHLSVSAGVANDRTEEVVRAILAEFALLKNTFVDEEELRKVKEHLVGLMYLGLESSDSIAEFCGIQELLRGEIKTPKEKERLIRAVTAVDVRTMARKIFTDKNLNLALIGPFKDSAQFKKMLTLA
jgi:predicted Zn-dependent peptidase